MRRSIIAVLVAPLLMATPAYAGSADNSASPVYSFGDGSVVERATSQLVRTDGGVTATLRTGGLAPGDAVTLWWVIFNNPNACSGVAPGHPFRCGEPDLFTPDTQASVEFAGGHVVGGDSAYAVAARHRVGDTSNCPFEAVGGPGFLCAGLIAPRTADVHLVVHSHGQALPEFMPDQIRTFEAACTPESTFGLGDGPNTCVDLQFTVHEAP